MTMPANTESRRKDKRTCEGNHYKAPSMKRRHFKFDLVISKY